MEIIESGSKVKRILKPAIPNTDYDRSKSTRECEIFKLFA